MALSPCRGQHPNPQEGPQAKFFAHLCLYHRSHGLFKSTNPLQPHMVFQRILFHLSVCVLAAAVWVSCASEPTRIPTEGGPLPADHQVVNWMEVLHELPEDQNRAEALAHMTEAHPEFWPLWCEDILQLGNAQDSVTVDVLRQFLTEMRPMLEAIDSTSGQENVLRRETEALLDGLKRHQVLFPQDPVPDVVWMPSGFNFALYPTPTCLAVGLDWFMGPTQPLLLLRLSSLPRSPPRRGRLAGSWGRRGDTRCTCSACRACCCGVWRRRGRVLLRS